MPTTWDETKVLEGKPGEYLVMARRKGAQWYVAAMTNDQPREFQLQLPFLGDQDVETRILKDGVNARRIAIDYKLDTTAVSGRHGPHNPTGPRRRLGRDPDARLGEIVHAALRAAGVAHQPLFRTSRTERGSSRERRATFQPQSAS